MVLEIQMQESQDVKSEEKRKGVASLFDDYEMKDWFRRYVYLLVTVEVIIFLVCWVYQLGIDEVAVTGHPVDIPFPWKAYFLVSVSAPVVITFMIGVVVLAFNNFAYGQKNGNIFSEDGLEGSMAKIAKVANFCMQLPFMLSLVLLGVLVTIVYNMEMLLEYLSRFGDAASKFLLYGLGGVLAAGTVYLVARMIINYKLHKRNLEYEYKREVMDRLGIAIIDNKTMIDSKGNVLGPRQIDVTPTPPSQRILPAAEQANGDEDVPSGDTDVSAAPSVSSDAPNVGPVSGTQP